MPWIPLVSLDYIVGYHLHLVRRSFVEYIVYHAASSSPSHTAQLLLHRSIRRIQHSVIEPVVYCTTSSSSSCSTRQQSERFRQRETSGVPGRGGRSDWREELTRVTKRPWQGEGGLFGDFLTHLTRGEAQHREARHRAARLEDHHRAARLDGVHRAVQDKGQQDRQIP